MRQIDKLHRLLVLVDGPDGAGKNTFIDHLRELFQYQVYSYDRFGPGSCFVYDELFSRPAALRRNYVGELQLLERAFDVRQVLLTAPPLVLQQRIKARPQQPDKGEATIHLLATQVALFGRWGALSGRFVPTITLWTDQQPATVIARVAYEWLTQTLDTRLIVDTPTAWEVVKSGS